MFKRLFVPTALIATLLIIGTGTLQAAPPVDDPPQAFFNGAPVAPGGVIATGVPVSGGCMMPTTAIEGVLPNDFASGEITVSIDKDCQMTLDAFTNVQAPTPSGGAMASSSGTRFKGWAKSELNDPLESTSPLCTWRLSIGRTNGRYGTDTTSEYAATRSLSHNGGSSVVSFLMTQRVPARYGSRV